MEQDELKKHIDGIPVGCSEATFRGKKYGVSRTDFSNGRSTKIYAEELGGNNHISFNFYRTKNAGLLKTCEMPEEKVITFLREYEIL